MKNVTRKKFNHTKNNLRNTTKLNNREINERKYCQRGSSTTMTKLIDSQTQSANANAYRKVRLKCGCANLLKRTATSEIVTFLTLMCIISSVSCLETRNNRPPRFLIDNQHSEIVLRLKEGPDTPVGKMPNTLLVFVAATNSL